MEEVKIPKRGSTPGHPLPLHRFILPRSISEVSHSFPVGCGAVVPGNKTAAGPQYVLSLKLRLSEDGTPTSLTFMLPTKGARDVLCAHAANKPRCGPTAVDPSVTFSCELALSDLMGFYQSH